MPQQELGFPDCSAGKESACNAGDLGLIPGSGRFPGEGNGNPLQYPCLDQAIREDLATCQGRHVMFSPQKITREGSTA